MATKAELREEARARRRSIPESDRVQFSERIAEHALALPELAPATTVACYASMGSEVSTTLLLRGLFAQGKAVVVPVAVGDQMRFVRLTHPWSIVKPERMAPVPRQPWEEVSADALDIVFVPGVLFGRDGSRLGQGGGHFDRFLGAHPRPFRVGLAFEAQLVDRVPATEPHDEGMDVIVTELGRLHPGRPASG